MRRGLRTLLLGCSGLVCLAAGAVLIIEFSFDIVRSNTAVFSTLYQAFVGYFVLDIICRVGLDGRRFFSRHKAWITDLALIGPPLLAIPSLAVLVHFGAVQVSLLIVVLGRLGHVMDTIGFLKLKPAQLLVLGFLMAIFIGALLLKMPVSGQVTGVDALFIATSAVCVTGLSTIDIGTHFSHFGQLIILILIQIGGLGIMGFSVIFAHLFQKKLSHNASMTIQESFFAVDYAESLKLIKSMFKMTLVIEAIGAIFLFVGWYSEFESVSQAVYYSVFHSVSAFCNAGFSLFSNSLVGFQSNPWVVITVGSLIILGGLGFPVLYNLMHHNFKKHRFTMLRIQTKFALQVTFILIGLGAVVLFALESGQSFAGMSVGEKWLASFFQSVSARTAGFNTVDIAGFGSASLLVIMVLMLIGASPGSTGGGLKTTTVGLMVKACWDTLRGADQVTLFGRSIPPSNVMRALSFVGLAILIIMGFSIALLIGESSPTMTTVFETVSAFGTVGFSIGLTSQLSTLGKLFIMIVMFVGRVGALTIAFALATRTDRPNIQMPTERIPIV